jgi:hypothetical protein
MTMFDGARAWPPTWCRSGAHFGEKVYDTVIPRNVRNSEAPASPSRCLLRSSSRGGRPIAFAASSRAAPPGVRMSEKSAAAPMVVVPACPDRSVLRVPHMTRQQSRSWRPACGVAAPVRRTLTFNFEPAGAGKGISPCVVRHADRQRVGRARCGDGGPVFSRLFRRPPCSCVRTVRGQRDRLPTSAATGRDPFTASPTGEVRRSHVEVHPSGRFLLTAQYGGGSWRSTARGRAASGLPSLHDIPHRVPA